MEDYYDNKKKEFSYKMTGWSFIGILIVFLILILANNSNIKNNNTKHADVVDSTWVEFPNTVTKTTPRYFNKTKSGFVFTTNYEKYQKGDTILK